MSEAILTASLITIDIGEDATNQSPSGEDHPFDEYRSALQRLRDASQALAGPQCARRATTAERERGKSDEVVTKVIKYRPLFLIVAERFLIVNERRDPIPIGANAEQAERG
jgi:hypothetical protein